MHVESGMTKSRGIDQPKAEWTEDRLETLRRFYAAFKTEDVACILALRTGQVYAKAKQLGLATSEAYLASPAACRLRRGDNVSAEGADQLEQRRQGRRRCAGGLPRHPVQA